MKFPDFPPLHFGAARRLPLITQSEAAECGLACIAMIAGYHGYDVDLLTLRQRFSFSTRGATLKNLVDVGRALQLSARPVKVEIDDLKHLRMPCVLHWNSNHFVVLHEVRTAPDGSLSAIRIHDPAHGKCTVKAAQVDAAFTGVALELVPEANFQRGREKQQISIRELASSAVGLRPALLQIFGLSLALETFALTSPLLMQLVVDGPIASNDRDMLTVVALGFAMLMLFQTAFGAFRSWVVLYVSTHLSLQWTSNVFSHLLHLPLSFFEKRYLGDVLSRFNSISVIQETLSTRFIEAVLDGLLTVTVFLALLAYSAQLALVVAVAVLAYFVLRTLMFVAARRASEDQLACKAREQSVFLESIRGIQAIKLLNHEAQRHARWLNLLADTINRNIATQKLNLFFATASNFIKGLENILVVWLGARLVIDHAMSVGMLYAFLGYKLMLTGRAYALIDKQQELKMLALQGERLADIVLTPREQADGEAGAAACAPASLSIELKGVSFRYSDVDPWILRDLNVVIQPGESVAIVGRSGCGKTTLLKLLIGILTPTEGEILIAGVPLSRFGLRRYRSLAGVVMQDDQLFAGTVTDNISFFDDEVDMAAVMRCAEMAAIARDLEAMPMGYQTLIGDMGTSLSGGQKQRLLLARALYRSPQILFLDEATSHLDANNERRVNEAIQQLAISRVIVAHRQETIASVSRVLEIADGKVVRDLMQEEARQQPAAARA
jgi:ATP-binding cassette subfamily B protein RaxB